MSAQFTFPKSPQENGTTWFSQPVKHHVGTIESLRGSSHNHIQKGVRQSEYQGFQIS